MRLKKGKDGPFQKLEAKIAKEPGAHDPAAEAAAAGRKSLGQAEMTRRSVAGRKESQDEEQIAGPSLAEKSRLNSKLGMVVGVDAPASMPSEELSRPDTNPTVPNAMSDAMDSLKARSFGGVSLDSFGFGRSVDTRAGSPSYFAFGAPLKANDTPTSPGKPDVLSWGAPFAYGPGGYNSPGGEEAKGGITASGMGAGGIGQGKDAGLGKDAVHGIDKIAGLWK
jgi:hypothetical protein